MYQFNETFPENLSIEQVSRIFNIPKSTLRYWEDKGLLHPIRNKENGYREYSRYAITEIEDLLTYKTMHGAVHPRYAIDQKSRSAEGKELLPAGERSSFETIGRDPQKYSFYPAPR
ncbi:MerR family transcriptional regulator [Clostridiales Family XIII bacterium ASD5510]|uniref:MerR family transcriptional regulator n=1 Tax=Hominibacterium faecale TaxID=2839743 RepID=A0A9J6QUM4_9FIRM|nr:MerR family transcriptional regulator [Hominibacterium faecale]MCU7378591.1 MerR family transcriptional regulator [Hominibacterium faecale]